MRRAERARGLSRSSTFRTPGFFVSASFVLLLLGPARTHAQGAGSDSLALSWTAPGDDGNVGTVTSYEVRRSTAPITDANFAAATLVANPPAPLPASARQRMIARGLTRGTPYYFAVRARDDAGNVSSVSNLVFWDWSLDSAPPSAPAGATAAVQAEGKAVALSWRANPEADLAGYHVYRSLLPTGPWTRITTALVRTPQYRDDAIPLEATDLHYQISAIDQIGNESARSANVRVTVKSTTGGAPLAWKLLPAYPNPSRLAEVTRIPVEIPASARTARIDVLDGGNQLVRRFEVAGASFGVSEVVWDGNNAAGQPCAPGVYRAWLIAGDERQMVRIARVP